MKERQIFKGEVITPEIILLLLEVVQDNQGFPISSLIQSLLFFPETPLQDRILWSLAQNKGNVRACNSMDSPLLL